jgi:predicted phosphodiesterase
MRTGDILLGGHTHVPVFEMRRANDGLSYLHINPGSVSLPKENSPRSYVIIDGDHVTFHALEGEVYREEMIK